MLVLDGPVGLERVKDLDVLFQGQGCDERRDSPGVAGIPIQELRRGRFDRRTERRGEDEQTKQQTDQHGLSQ